MKKDDFAAHLDFKFQELDRISGCTKEALEHFQAEIRFAAKLAETHPRQKVRWQKLILQAVTLVRNAVTRGTGIEEAVKFAEVAMAPLGEAAKKYTVHCVGHAHIDMNWMWNWPETVATVNDTFTTVDRLLQEFPTFHFSQSQASVYQIMKDYLPELYAKVKKHVRDGRWEVTASQWVECDKNLSSGEILCRHLLYTRRFFKQEFGLSDHAVAIDWEPDTFGHAHTVPGILARAGVRRYYFHRGGAGPELFWWQGADGSRVLAFDDRKRGYNGSVAAYFVNPRLVNDLFEYEAKTGLKDYLFVYGVGDHGGGPTQRDLTAALKLNALPVFPNIKLSTTGEFFSIAETKAAKLPVVDGELNFALEGCYTSQSNIKYANRRSENALMEAELTALLGKGLARMAYPMEAFRLGWRNAMFNQFHDILPGSGVRATYQHAQGLFQEILARTGAIKTRTLRAIAAMVNTRSACLNEPPAWTGPGANVGGGIGAGPGDFSAEGMVSRRGTGEAGCHPFVVFNPTPWSRSEVVSTRVWDVEIPDERIAVKDDAGRIFAGQVLERGNYWGHRFITVAFPARDVGGLGYRSYSIGEHPSVIPSSVCRGDGEGTIENEFLRLEVEPSSGAIIHLVDRQTGMDLVPRGERLGVLEYMREAPHSMTAWVFGQIVKTVPFLKGAVIDGPQKGPHVATIRARHKFNESTFTMTISLAAGVPRVDFVLEVNWLERGSPEVGVPMLKVAFPLAIKKPVATFECPNGSVRRSTDPKDIPCRSRDIFGVYFSKEEPVDLNPAEVPAQKWADLRGRHASTNKPVGAILLNDSKYGHRVDGNTIRLTLLRSSYDPDPLPELGRHTIRFAIQPHVSKWSASDGTRAGYTFNLPFNVVGTTAQQGSLPPSRRFADILTPNVMLSSMKQAEDSGAVIIRLYEMEGKAVNAQVRFDPALVAGKARAVETDLLEQPRKSNTARMKNGVLTVSVPAFGLVTVRIG